MAKNLSGDLTVASANRLVDGIVVFLDDAGQWTARLERAVEGLSAGCGGAFGLSDCSAARRSVQFMISTSRPGIVRPKVAA